MVQEPQSANNPQYQEGLSALEVDSSALEVDSSAPPAPTDEELEQQMFEQALAMSLETAAKEHVRPTAAPTSPEVCHWSYYQ